MRLLIECKYCGHSWVIKAYSKHAVKQCEKCKDTNLKAKEIDNKIDYYEGSPAFVTDESDDPFWGLGGD